MLSCVLELLIGKSTLLSLACSYFRDGFCIYLLTSGFADLAAVLFSFGGVPATLHPCTRGICFLVVCQNKGKKLLIVLVYLLNNY